MMKNQLGRQTSPSAITAVQTVGLVLFVVGALGMVAATAAGLLMLLDTLIGGSGVAEPWYLLVGLATIAVAGSGIGLYGRIPRVTRRVGCLGAIAGVGLLLMQAASPQSSMGRITSALGGRHTGMRPTTSCGSSWCRPSSLF